MENKITDKITSIGKPKEIEEIYIPPEKRFQNLLLKKWIEVYDKWGRNYNVNKEIRIKTLKLRSDLCDYSNAYIVVKRNITTTKKKHLLLMILKHPIIQ